MSMAVDEPLEDLLARVPPEWEREVRRFLQQVVHEDSAGPRTLQLDWAGSLAHLDKTGVELEEEALRAWGD